MVDRYSLVVRPDGRAILATPRNLSDTERVELTALIRGWDEGRFQVLVVPGCDVVVVKSIDLAGDGSFAETVV